MKISDLESRTGGESFSGDYLTAETVTRTMGVVSFYREGKLQRAAILSLSENGARFISRTVDVHTIFKGRAGEYYFWTTYGRSKCRGITRNITRSDSTIIWEIEFIELSPYMEDPIRKALSDIFQEERPVTTGLSNGNKTAAAVV